MNTKDKNEIHVAAAIILNRDHQILIAKRHKSDSHREKRWEFPGGKIKPHETPVQALRREITEELEVSLDKIEFYKSLSHEYDPTTVHLQFFICTLLENSLPKAHVHEEIKWVKSQELSGYDFLEADVDIIQEIPNYLELWISRMF